MAARTPALRWRTLTACGWRWPRPAAAKASRIDIYPEAPHAFHADYRPSYRKAEADQAWQRMLDWFKQNGL